MIKNYIKKQMFRSLMISMLLIAIVGVYYSVKIASAQSSSPALLNIKKTKDELGALTQERDVLKSKIEKLSVFGDEATGLVARQKKYEMDPKKEQIALFQIFNALSKEYGLFDVAVADVSHDSEFLNLLNVKLVVSSVDAMGIEDENTKESYTKKMRELVVLYLYKNKTAFSIYGEIEKLKSDTIAFKIIKRG